MFMYFYYCDSMPPLQWVSSRDFILARYSTVNCEWYYWKVKAFRNNSKLATKQKTT